MQPFRSSLKYILFLAIVCGGAEVGFGQFSFPQMGKAAKVEADPKKDYFLKDSDGNWLAMAAKFSDEKAAYRAKKLAYELRKAYKMEAFVFKFDPSRNLDAFSAEVDAAKNFHYQTAQSVEYAVLVGGYPVGDDLELQKTLDRLRRCQPESLKDDPASKALAQKFQEMARKDQKYAGYGPMGGAFAVPNPLLPKEFFSQKGIVDSYVEKLNSDGKYSLLNNDKLYTVRVATFSGDVAMYKNTQGPKTDEMKSRLRYAGLRAAALCEALRNAGVEAWEFHDRDCSFVTVGSFDSYGVEQANGQIELNPKIDQIMKKYGGKLVDGADGRSKYRAYTVVVDIPDPESTALRPKKKRLELACDLRPVIIVVPQRSGEASVRKIALAQQKMRKAQRQIEEAKAERALAVADANLRGAEQYDGETMDSNELVRSVAQALQEQNQGMTADAALAAAQKAVVDFETTGRAPAILQNLQTAQMAQTAPTNAPYAAQVPQTAQTAQSPQTAAAQTPYNPAQAQAATQQRQTAQAQAATQQRQTAQAQAATQQRQTAQAQTATQQRQTAQAQTATQQRQTAQTRPYGAAAPVRSAQKPAAPTY
ncbi:MAG: hypothetical protein IKW13_02745 [Thermoguttaceae bacterium]|nr:hypothetical protein [Thermoguttaceae bacterium]